MPALAAALLAAAAAAAPSLAPPSAALVRRVAGAEIDFAAGTITARAGSAADYRLPSVEMARPGAERRARASALAKMKAALTELDLAPGRKLGTAEVDAALSRVETASVDFQSNGGAVVALTIRFEDLFDGRGTPASSPGPSLFVAAAHLVIAPSLVAGKEAVVPRFAQYRLGDPPKAAKALPAKRDDAGRITVDPAHKRRLAGAAVTIYLHQVLPD
jgi:hypothetical protein